MYLAFENLQLSFEKANSGRKAKSKVQMMVFKGQT